MTPEAAVALVECFWEEIGCVRSFGDGLLRDREVRHHVRRCRRRRARERQGLGCRFQSRFLTGSQAIESFVTADGLRASSCFGISGRNNGIFRLPAWSAGGFHR